MLNCRGDKCSFNKTYQNLSEKNDEWQCHEGYMLFHGLFLVL